VSEIALAITLLIGTGLLSHSLVRLLEVDGGFDASSTLTLEIQATGASYQEDAAVYDHFDRVLERVRAIPGVVAAGLSNQVPLDGNFDRYGIYPRDRVLAPDETPSADRYVTSPGFMRAMGMRLVRGRDLEQTDNHASAAPVVVLSESIAERLWPGQDPIGHHVRLGDPEGPWREVVGVTADVRHHGLDSDLPSQIFIPPRQWMFADNVVKLVVRTSGAPASLAPAVRDAVHALDASQPIMRIQTMDQMILRSLARRRVALFLFLVFAGMAAALAGAGIYGMLAGDVTDRTREIGVRSALGATPAGLVAIVLRDASRLTLAGTIIGLAGGLAMSRSIESLLYEVGGADPITFAAVAVVMGAVAMVACLAPAVRTVRIDPRRALETR
jgi:predicted permease